MYRQAQRDGVDVVRLHTGEPAIYGAIGEQMDALDRLGIDYEVVPGISSFQAAAAALRVELTAPEVAQTVILTRTPGRTPMPASEDLSRLAQSRATLCIFLSADRLAEMAAMLAEHYGPDCPAAVVYHASWPDQKVVRGTLADIARRGAAAEARARRPSSWSAMPWPGRCRMPRNSTTRRSATVIGGRTGREDRHDQLEQRGARIAARLAAKLPPGAKRAASSTCDIFLHADATESPNGLRADSSGSST